MIGVFQSGWWMSIVSLTAGVRRKSSPSGAGLADGDRVGRVTQQHRPAVDGDCRCAGRGRATAAAGAADVAAVVGRERVRPEPVERRRVAAAEDRIVTEQPGQSRGLQARTPGGLDTGREVVVVRLVRRVVRFVPDDADVVRALQHAGLVEVAGTELTVGGAGDAVDLAPVFGHRVEPLGRDRRLELVAEAQRQVRFGFARQTSLA